MTGGTHSRPGALCSMLAITNGEAASSLHKQSYGVAAGCSFFPLHTSRNARAVTQADAEEFQDGPARILIGHLSEAPFIMSAIGPGQIGGKVLEQVGGAAWLSACFIGGLHMYARGRSMQWPDRRHSQRA